MPPIPLPVRVAAGLVVTALEQARKFPEQLTELPVTAASRAIQTGMRLQQRVTELAIKGDEVLCLLRPVEDTPPWARFDEDDDQGGEADTEPRTPAPRADTTGTAADPSGEDRELAGVVPGPGAARAATAPDGTAPDGTAPDGPGLDSTGLDSAGFDSAAPDGEIDEADVARGMATEGPAPTSHEPSALPGYDEMTLAQLRGKLRALSLPELEALLEHEHAHQDRPPFITMLSNRIVTVRSQ